MGLVDTQDGKYYLAFFTVVASGSNLSTFHFRMQR